MIIHFGLACNSCSSGGTVTTINEEVGPSHEFRRVAGKEDYGTL